MNLNITLAEGVSLELIQIPAGKFWMGSDIMVWDEKPIHEVFLPEYY